MTGITTVLIQRMEIRGWIWDVGRRESERSPLWKLFTSSETSKCNWLMHLDVIFHSNQKYSVNDSDFRTRGFRRSLDANETLEQSILNNFFRTSPPKNSFRRKELKYYFRRISH